MSRYRDCVLDCIMMLIMNKEEALKKEIEKVCSNVCNCSESTVRRYLYELVEKGVLRKVRVGHVVYVMLP